MQETHELSEPYEEAENTQEDCKQHKHTEEAKCETVPDVCLGPDVNSSLLTDECVNGAGYTGQNTGHAGATHLVTIPDGKTAEVKMRAPLRKYSSKRTASYRWSGTEMFQLEGERNCPSPVPETPEISRKDLEATRANIAYKKTCVNLSKKITQLGLLVSPSWDREHARSGDNCVRALIDQICQPWQDFKVWDREDHGFLRWYLTKQVEIQVAGGREDHFLRGEARAEPKAFLERMGQDNEFMNNDFLFSTARVLNKDIFVVESDGSSEVAVFRGGPGGGPGKGPPLVLGHLDSQEAGGKDYYQSIVAGPERCLADLLNSIPVSEQRS